MALNCFISRSSEANRERSALALLIEGAQAAGCTEPTCNLQRVDEIRQPGNSVVKFAFH